MKLFYYTAPVEFENPQNDDGEQSTPRALTSAFDSRLMRWPYRLYT